MGAAIAVLSSPLQAESARDILMGAAFGSPDQTTALSKIGLALASADAAIRRNPQDYSARLQRGLAISYRGKLTRSRADLLTARRELEAVAAANPRDPEAQMAVAGWHLGAVIELGPFMARSALGARTAKGNEALGRSLALGGDRPSILALASMERIQLNPADVAGARRLAEAAAQLRANTPFDRVMQRQAGTLLGPLRQGDGKVAAAVAKRLMPFGRVGK